MSSQYRKAILALVGALLVVASQLGLGLTDAVSDAVLAAVDSCITLATAFGVFRVPNAPTPPAVPPPL